MLKKLRLKFVLINMGIVLAMLLVIFATVFHFTKSDLRRQSDSMLQILTQSATQPGGFRDPGREIKLPYFVLQIYLNGDMQIVGRTYHDLSDENFLSELVKLVYSENKPEGEIEKYALRYKTFSYMGTQKLIFLDISSQNAALTSLFQSSALIGAISLLVFLVISILLARWSIKPVETAWAQQKQFISDASHELKTPITVILNHAELLKDPNYDEESKSRFTENIITMTGRMRSLVEGMLELTRADSGRLQQTFSLLDISELTEEALLPFEPILFEKGITLESQIEPGIYTKGSADHLQQIIGILLDNAGKYAAPGIVSVSLSRQGRGSCLLTIANPGEPIAKEELTKIFDRFYRVNNARTGDGSFGLGLSIAKSITETHKGKIWAESNPTGNCFFVQLPIL